ncbi:MAG: peptidoglycan D,D-transpeptidase FtsI family protein [Nocardioides sp.]
MNKPIRTIAIFCLLLFVGLMLNVTYLQYYKASALDNDSRNGRVIAATYSRQRGSILAGRTTIAESVPSNDQYQYQRKYPLPLMYAPLTGWYTLGNRTGLESSQNSFLSGEDSRLFVTRLVDLANGNNTVGGNIITTINPAAQAAAYHGLAALGPGTQGAVVAIEPSTGKILAMVSYPSYDPNLLASHNFKAADKSSKRLNTDPAQPLLNRAIQTTLPPGSTFKVVTAAAALESGNYTASSMVPGGATYRLPQSTKVINNEGRNCGTGRIPFTLAMENSCNTSFAALAAEVGADGMHKQAEAFGFNQDYLTDIAGQARSLYPAGMDAPQTAISGFGQSSVTASPLQMAMVVAGIANGGEVMTPYLVQDHQSADLDSLGPANPQSFSQAVKPTTATELTKLLVATVAHGTATPAAIPGVPVAGKTGTAETGRPGEKPYAWFISFAPADNDPKVAVAVMIQKVDRPTTEIAGGLLGGPIAKAVMEAVLK